MTEPALRDAVERKLGRKPFVDVERADVLIEGEETAAGHGAFRARVVQRDRRGALLGSRDLEAQSCASLLRAATLVVALIIDPHGDGRGRDSAEAPPSEAPPRERPPPRSEPDLTSTKPSRRRPDELRRAEPPLVARSSTMLRLALGGGVGTSVGVLPSASTTLFASARLVSRSRWSFDWRGGYSLPQNILRPDVRAHFAAVEQKIRACFAFLRWSSGVLDGCGGFAWGAVLPSTTGVRQGDDSWRVLTGPTGGAALQLDRDAAAVRIEIGVTLPFRKYSFSYFDVANTRKDLYSTHEIIVLVSLSGLGTISP